MNAMKKLAKSARKHVRQNFVFNEFQMFSSECGDIFQRNF